MGSGALLELNDAEVARILVEGIFRIPWQGAGSQNSWARILPLLVAKAYPLSKGVREEEREQGTYLGKAGTN